MEKATTVDEEPNWLTRMFFGGCVCLQHLGQLVSCKEVDSENNKDSWGWRSREASSNDAIMGGKIPLNFEQYSGL